MTGYLKRNGAGVKEIREGDVRPPFKMTYAMRHAGGDMMWTAWWEQEIAWDNAKKVSIHPGLYWAFPEEEGKIEYALFGGFAIPTNVAPRIVLPSDRRLSRVEMHKQFERLIHEDGGYKARRNAKDGGL